MLYNILYLDISIFVKYFQKLCYNNEITELCGFSARYLKYFPCKLGFQVCYQIIHVNAIYLVFKLTLFTVICQRFYFYMPSYIFSCHFCICCYTQLCESQHCSTKLSPTNSKAAVFFYSVWVVPVLRSYITSFIIHFIGAQSFEMTKFHPLYFFSCGHSIMLCASCILSFSAAYEFVLIRLKIFNLQ